MLVPGRRAPRKSDGSLTYLVPETLLFIPLFQIVGKLGLLNSYWALVVVYPTIAGPFCTWILSGARLPCP